LNKIQSYPRPPSSKNEEKFFAELRLWKTVVSDDIDPIDKLAALLGPPWEIKEALSSAEIVYYAVVHLTLN